MHRLGQRVLFGVALAAVAVQLSAQQTQPGPLQLAITSVNGSSVPAGLKLQLQATRKFFRGNAVSGNATNLVTWSSLSPQVAFVSNQPGSQGVVTGLKQGPAVIGARSGGLYAAISINVTTPLLTGILLTPQNDSIAISAVDSINASGVYSDNSTGPVSVNWLVTPASVAVMTGFSASAVQVMGVAAGTATISATAINNSNISAATKLNVGLLSVALSPLNATIPLGTSQQFTATGSFSGGGTLDVTNAVDWLSLPASVATISASGNAASISQGSTTISALSGSVTNSTTLIVGMPVVATVTVTPANAILLAGDAQQFTATAHFTDNSTQDVTGLANWSSSAPLVASIIAASGLAHGLTVGASAITATFNGHSGMAQLNVRPASRFAYALNAGDGTISFYTVNEGSGNLRPNGWLLLSGAAGAQAVKADPSGRFLYVANRSSGNISGFAIDAARGGLRPMPNSPYAAGNGPKAMAMDGKDRFLYAANQNTTNPGVISGFAINATDGSLTPLPSPSTASGNNPADLAITPDNKYLYAANAGSASITAYSIANDGTLNSLGAGVSSGGSSSQALAIDPSGKFLLVVNNGSNTVNVFTIDDASGALTQVSGAPFNTGAQPSAVMVDASGSFVYVANHDSSSVSAFALDANTGKLTTLAGAPFVISSAPASLASDAAGRYLYVTEPGVNEIAVYAIDAVSGALHSFESLRARVGVQDLTLATGSAAHYTPDFLVASTLAAGGGLISYAVDPASGVLTRADAITTGLQGAYAVTANPAGSFVYATDEQVSGKIYGFALDAMSGGFAAIPAEPFSAGSRPAGLATDSSGRFLYAANITGNNVSGYNIDPASGALSSLNGLPFSSGNNPLALVADPSGRFLYAANPGDPSITLYSMDALTGALTRFPVAFESAQVFAVAVHPSGRFAYALNNIPVNGVQMFGIDSNTGALTGGASFMPTGRSPTALALDGDGKFLYVVNFDVGTISAFTVNPATGILSVVPGSPFATGVGSPGLSCALSVDPSGQFLYLVSTAPNQVSRFAIDASSGALSSRTDFAAGAAPSCVTVTGSIP